ncbi:MAG: hypothetical protein ABSF55_03035 [Candidatus Staskawiczbacteria bacterium]
MLFDCSGNNTSKSKAPDVKAPAPAAANTAAPATGAPTPDAPAPTPPATAMAAKASNVSSVEMSYETGTAADLKKAKEALLELQKAGATSAKVVVNHPARKSMSSVRDRTPLEIESSIRELKGKILNMEGFVRVARLKASKDCGHPTSNVVHQNSLAQMEQKLEGMYADLAKLEAMR